jgi:hypothetical protein
VCISLWALKVTTTVAPEETVHGMGGVPANVDDRDPEPKAEATPAPKPRYAEGVTDLSDQVLAARKQVGRTVLAEFMGLSPSAVWRWENEKGHEAEVEQVRTQVARFGELPQPEPKKAGRVDHAVALLHKAQGDKSVTRAQLIEELLGILAPADAPKAYAPTHSRGPPAGRLPAGSRLSGVRAGRRPAARGASRRGRRGVRDGAQGVGEAAGPF